MAWPCRTEVWGDRLEGTKQGYAAVANVIRQFEPVTMLVRPKDAIEARQMLGSDIDILKMSIDDSWTRDSGPCFVINGKGKLAGADLRFNAWGNKYQPHDQDALMARRILDHIGVPRFSSQLTAEGGGLSVDGEGTLITTESCFLNTNRNPGWTKRDVEQELEQMLGVEKAIWLPSNVEETETDGHVDGIGVFVRPGVVLIERSPDPSAPGADVMEENVKALEGATDAKGRPIELVFIEQAQSADTDGGRFCRSYVNGYIANGGVITPCYGTPEDERARAVFETLFPERRVVQVPIGDVAIGGGGIHCITQQQPTV
jgi:agmatine deiminase